MPQCVSACLHSWCNPIDGLTGASLFRISGIQNTLVAFYCALAAQALLRLLRSVSKGWKLEAGQLKNLCAILILSATLGNRMAKKASVFTRKRRANKKGEELCYKVRPVRGGAGVSNPVEFLSTIRRTDGQSCRGQSARARIVVEISRARAPLHRVNGTCRFWGKGLIKLQEGE